MINRYLLVSMSLFCCGLLFYAYLNDIIIIRIPKKITNSQAIIPSVQKKMVSLFFHNINHWHHEDCSMLWKNATDANIQGLISIWLSWAYDEKYMQKKICLDSAIVTEQSELYLSFDRNPFSKEQSTFQKLLWIESILKTLRGPVKDVNYVYFLIHHEVIQDPHFDFSKSFPINGYLEN